MSLCRKRLNYSDLTLEEITIADLATLQGNVLHDIIEVKLLANVGRVVLISLTAKHL